MKKSVYDVLLEPVTEGLISENIISHYVVPKGAVSYAENMHNDTLGYMVSRRSFVSVGTSPAAQVLSCYLYQLASVGSTGYITWQEGTSFKVQDLLGTGGVTTHAATFGLSQKQRYDTIQGYLLMTNVGTAQPKLFNVIATPPAAIAGTAFPTSMNLVSAGFNGRVWMASDTDATNKLYYSDVVPAAGIASLTGGASYLTINANDGDKITGFARLQNVLYVFTHNGIFRCYNTQSLDNTSISNVGCFNQEAIIKGKNGFYFYHPSGIYFIGSNGFPQEVSAKIRDIIQKIPNANQSSVFGWADDDHVYYNVGNLPALSSTKQYILRYTMSTQVWTVYTITSTSASLIPRCAAYENFASTSITSDDIYPSNVLFVDDGINYYKGTFNIYNPSTVNIGVSSDFTNYPVYIDYQTHWMTFELEAHTKRINGITQSHENGAGLKFAYQTDKDTENIWHPIGELDSNYVTLFPSFQSDHFNRIKFRVYGESKGVIIKIGAPTIISLDDLGFEKN